MLIGRLAFLASVASLALAWAVPGWAVEFAYDERMFPAVSAIDVVDGNLQVTLGQRWFDDPDNWTGIDQTAPTITYDPAESRWLAGKRVPVARGWAGVTKDDCAELIPPIELSADDLFRLRPNLVRDRARDPAPITQEVGACERVGDTIWFGISFYEGEGASGVGGIGRFDVKAGTVEVRRPWVLRGVSVNRILADGSLLWIGTTAQGEYAGVPPAAGLVSYDWETDRIMPQGQGEGMCGFVVHDLELVGDDLWVASDLGLSMGRALGEKTWRSRYWQHFVPRPDGEAAAAVGSCHDLHRDLLDTLPREPDEAVAGGMNFHRVFVTQVAKFHPHFLWPYVAKRTSKK